MPSLRGEPPGTTTPEELLAASHAVCYGIGLRSVIGRGGGSASKVLVTATITVEKGPAGICVRRSHLAAVLEDLEGIDESALAEIGRTVEQECTISTVIRTAVEISYDITSVQGR